VNREKPPVATARAEVALSRTPGRCTRLRCCSST
jgi:hypothetical protein